SALDGQRTLSVGAEIVYADATQVRAAIEAAVTLPVRIQQMPAFDIGAADEVAQVDHAAVRHGGNRQVHRTDAAGRAAEHLPDLFVAGHGKGCDDALHLGRFHVVDVLVATDEQGD